MRYDPSPSSAFSIPRHRDFTTGLISTSLAFGWKDLRVETRRHSGGEFHFAPFEDYLLSVHLGAPLFLERSRKGERLRREQMVCGSAVLVPAGQVSVWRHAEPTHYLNLHLSPDLLNRTAAQMGFGDCETSVGAHPAAFHDPQVEQISHLLRLEMEAGAPHGRLYAEMLASALCVHLLQREPSTARRLPSVLPASRLRAELRQAVAYIQDNLMSDLSLDVIAREAGLSACYFARLFAEAFGVPPHQYVIQARIERAKALMTDSGLSPGDAARLTGFADQSHFTRHFKRLAGVTPQTFARDYNRKNVP